MGLFRFLLAISVFMAHLPEQNQITGINGFGGENSVEIFFVMSGFFVALVLDKSYASSWNFYRSRALRLYPIYYILVLIILVPGVVFPRVGSSFFSYPAQALGISAIANTTFLTSDWTMFLQWHNNGLRFGNYQDSEIPLRMMLIIPQSWSLGIEVAFYLIAPFLCKKSTRTLIAIWSILVFVKITAATLGLNYDPWTHRFFPFELPMFLTGILLYRIRRRLKTNSYLLSSFHSYALLVSFYIGFSLLISSVDVEKNLQKFILLFVTTLVVILGNFNGSDRFLGDLAYPIYLTHVFMIDFCFFMISHFPEKLARYEFLKTHLVQTLLILLSTLLLSYTLLVIVKPIERIRGRLKHA